MKVAIIGAGRVGSTIAYAVLLRQLCDHLIIANRTWPKAQGDALDLRHALAFCERPARVEASTIEAVEGCDILVVTVSVPLEKPMRSRMELGQGNVALFRQIIPPLAANNPDALFIVVTNPVDVMTWVCTHVSGFPSRRVMGIGTLVDSARFRARLSDEQQIHPEDLRAYILGEHGPHQFPVFSNAQAGSEHIDDNSAHRELFRQVVQDGFQVHQAKGYTNYAIATAASLVIRCIAFDEHRTLPLATCFDEWLGVRNNCFSIPVVLGRAGILRLLHPQLNPVERQEMLVAAGKVREAIEILAPEDARAKG